jgi:hypothetical protein
MPMHLWQIDQFWLQWHWQIVHQKQCNRCVRESGVLAQLPWQLAASEPCLLLCNSQWGGIYKMGSSQPYYSSGLTSTYFRVGRSTVVKVKISKLAQRLFCMLLRRHTRHLAVKLHLKCMKVCPWEGSRFVEAVVVSQIIACLLLPVVHSSLDLSRHPLSLCSLKCLAYSLL